MDQQQASQTIIHLNSQGISAYEKGDLRAAIDALSQAFMKSKALFHVTIRGSDFRSSVEGIDPPCDSLMNYLLSTSCKCSTKIPLHREENMASSTTDDFVFQQAISLPASIPPEIIIRSCSFKLAILSVVLFNLALVFQALGTRMMLRERCSSEGYPWLNKAAKLYELAFRLQSESRVGCAALFPMVILNNLGQCYRSLGQQTNADTCFVQLLSMVMQYKNQEQPTDICSTTLMELLEVFIHSTSHLILKDRTGAAAAA